MEYPSEGRVNNADWASSRVGLMMHKTVRRQNKRSSVHETCEVFSKKRQEDRGAVRVCSVHRQKEESILLLFDGPIIIDKDSSRPEVGSGSAET
jgi:hypothetical protein